MSDESLSIKWSENILDYLIQKRELNPDLKFWVRKTNTKKRLDQGFWFNGTEKYVNIGFSKLGAGNLSSQSIAFVIWFDNNNNPQCRIEFVFRDEKKPKIIECYKEIVDKIGGFTKRNETEYRRGYQTESVYDALDEFLTEHKPIIDSVIKDFSLEDKINISNEEFEKSLSKILKKRKENLSFKTSLKSKTMSQNHPLNQILYGPPGTGKTYSTIDKVVEICAPEEYSPGNHQRNKAVYDQLVEEGKVFFTTFHQSFGYEDFIEGIKPVSPKKESDSITYEVEDGILKSISEQCLDEIREIKAQKDENIQEGMSFKEKYDEFVKRIQKGLVVIKTRNGLEAHVSRVSASGNMRLKTGKDTNDYIISVNRLEKLVEEVPKPRSIKNIHEKVKSIIGGSHSTLYYAALEAFVDFEVALQKEIKEEGKDIKLKDIVLTKQEIQDLPKYALIIDEINRGNVSAIFGELITLLEEDKRFGMDNQLYAKLPYSKLNFIVPPNLYIIGTMNTADRSVEALDTALRRRFSFKEMMPRPELLSEERSNGAIQIEGINLAHLLRTINERIEVLVDRDHTIGHSYFLNVKSESDLKNVFKDKVIPLLQEYFFGNYEKMEMVIGSYFFKKDIPTVEFAVQLEMYMEPGKRYVFKDFDDPEFDIIDALKGLLLIKDQLTIE